MAFLALAVERQGTETGRKLRSAERGEELDVRTRTVLLPPGGELAAGVQAESREPDRACDPCLHLGREGRVDQGRDVLPAPCPGKAGDRRELAEEGWPDGRGEVREVAEGARDPEPRMVGQE